MFRAIKIQRAIKFIHIKDERAVIPFIVTQAYPIQWRIQDFPEEGALSPKGGVPTYYLANFCRKLHENEEILGQRGGARPSRPPLDPPLPITMGSIMAKQ